jgi:branched-chain amino acid transport system substrate-binding protein
MKKSKQQLDIFQFLSIPLLMCLIWFSFGGRSENLKLGIILPLTGPFSLQANATKNGILLAAKQVNKSGGINGKNLEIIIEDNNNSPNLTAKACRNLIYDNSVLALLGGFTPENARVIQFFSEKSHTPYMATNCTHAELTRNKSSYTFRCISDDVKQFEAISEYSSKHNNVSKPAVIYDHIFYGPESAQKFFEVAIKNSQKIAAAVSFTHETLNFKKHIEALKASRPDGIIILAQPMQAALILRQIREANINIPAFGGNMLSRNKFRQYAGVYSESVVTTLPFNPRLGGQRAEYFLNEYLEEYSHSANANSALGYEAIMLLAYAMKTGGIQKTAILGALREMHGWEGVTGSGGFDKTGNQVKPAELAIIKEGQNIPVSLESLF